MILRDVEVLMAPAGSVDDLNDKTHRSTMYPDARSHFAIALYLNSFNCYHWHYYYPQNPHSNVQTCTKL
jgi:hypothetical protein